MSVFAANQYNTGTVVQHWTTQDGVTRGVVRTTDGQHLSGVLAFSAADLEGRRVQLMDGVWRLAGEG